MTLNFILTHKNIHSEDISLLTYASVLATKGQHQFRYLNKIIPVKEMFWIKLSIALGEPYEQVPTPNTEVKEV